MVMGIGVKGNLLNGLREKLVFGHGHLKDMRRRRGRISC